MRYDRAVDTFAVGCIMAEVYTSRRLFPDGIASDREHIALVERVCGPFSCEYATELEKTAPGTFKIRNGVARVVYPDDEFQEDVHGDGLRRLRQAKPVMVSHVATTLICY